MEYVDACAARTIAGLRLVLTRSVPNPWGEAAKGIFRYKGIPFTPVSQFPGAENADLRDWIGQTSAPAAVWNDEPARTSWAAIVHLADRLQRNPPLLPEAPEERLRVIGLCEELAGDDGLGWNLRQLLMNKWASKSDSGAQWAPPDDSRQRIQRKYGFSPGGDCAGPAHRRIVQILTLLSEHAECARARNDRYLIGGQLTAIDYYAAGFTGLIVPLGDELCPMEPVLRETYTVRDEEILAVTCPALLAHRDMMYSTLMEPPVHL